MTKLRALLVVFALTVPATAQQDVTITGVVEPLGPSICLDGTHQLECTSALLKSGDVNLNLDNFLGQNVRLTGKQSAACPVITVESVNPFPPATLVRCGSPTPGCPIRFRVGTPAIGQYILFISQSPNYLPVNPTIGTFLLGAPFFTLAMGNTGGFDSAVDIVIPNDPAVVGIEAWLQAARRDVGPVGPWQLSNAVCFTITGPSPPCQSLDC